jgi:hypothetical protein
MYVAAPAYPLTTEYVLLDVRQGAAAQGFSDGQFAFVERNPALTGPDRRSRSSEALGRHCVESGIGVAADLHGCPGAKGVPQQGGGSLSWQRTGRGGTASVPAQPIRPRPRPVWEPLRALQRWRAMGTAGHAVG